MTTTPPPLVVSVDDIARRAAIPEPVTGNDRFTIDAAIRDAMADVEAYLGRPITPREATETGLLPGWDGRWPVAHALDARGFTVTAETDTGGWPTGYYTVTYTYGLDARLPEYTPIQRYLVAHVLAMPTMAALWRAHQPEQGRLVSSLAVDGQSVTYANATLGPTAGAAGSGTPGAGPVLSSLCRWRIPGAVYQRPTPYPWGRP